tara:strand:- start:3210 stop:3467 length:258 start_codon:yes stop_codon:yes gene_type:complete
MSWPSILIRANSTWHREIDGVLQEVAPPTYKFFGEDHEGRGIYRVTETKGLLAVSEGHRYSWIPYRTFVAINKHALNQYSQVVVV